jgi:hypothetical protein
MARKIDWKVYVLIGVILSVGLGFLYGTGLLGGSSGDPGAREDPLVTQSYAEGALDQRIREMDSRINSLEAKIQSLESEISILTGTPVSTPPSGNTGTAGTNGGTTGNAGTGTGNGATTQPGSTAISAANIGKKATVTAEVVNLRESASTDSNIKGRLTPNDTFTITKVDNDWYQVQLDDGTLGWVAGRLVRIR